MQIQGDHHFAAPPDLVWQQLMDPDALRATIPGCEKFTTVGPDSYDMIVKVGISAIRGTYTGNVTMREIRNPPPSTGSKPAAAARPARWRVTRPSVSFPTATAPS